MDYSITHFCKIVCRDEILQIVMLVIGLFPNKEAPTQTRCCNENNPIHHYQFYDCNAENGLWENWDMVLIDKFGCARRLVAIPKEREIVDKLKPTLNHSKPLTATEEKRERRRYHYLSNIEYYKDNTSSIEKTAQNNIHNIERIIQKKSKNWIDRVT